jgi:hypothetical protein
MTDMSVSAVTPAFSELRTKALELSAPSKPKISSPKMPLQMTKHGGMDKMMPARVTSGRIAVNLKDLREMRSAAEDLLNELSSHRHTDMIADARKRARDAKSRYTQSYVHTEANGVLKECDEFEFHRSNAINNLRTMVNALGKTIDGYITLERSLVF